MTAVRASPLLQRMRQSVHRVPTASATRQQRRPMGGGGHYMTVSEDHRLWGEAFGVVCWLWVFHRARHDLPVVLGFRHPWEHAPMDPFDPSHGENTPENVKHAMQSSWDSFSKKALVHKEDDDDDDDDE